MEQIADSYYVKKVQSGDTEGFAPLVERYSRKIFSLIVKIVGSREDAEELTQDTFLKAFHSLSSFRADSSFSTWIYRIAYNIAISATRKTKNEWLSVDGESMEREAEEVVDEDLEASSEEQLRLLEKALAQLAPEDRALILLFYKQEKTMGEIANITDLSVSNVKVKVHRIRKKLIEWIKTMED